MIHFVLDAASAIAHRTLSLVAGRDEAGFRERCTGYPELAVLRQERPQGTADALRSLETALLGQDGDILVLFGDLPLLTTRSLGEMLHRHVASGAACTIGRKAESEIEAGVYCLGREALKAIVRGLAAPAPPGERGLSKAAAALAGGGAVMASYRFADPDETLDVDDFLALSRVETLLQDRANRLRMTHGVALSDPRTTWIDPLCRIEADVRIGAGCTLVDSALESGVEIGNFCRVARSRISVGARLRDGTRVEDSSLGRDCRVGPYAFIRGGSILAESVRIGSFVEIESSTFGAGTSLEPLCVLRDARIGRRVRIGAGFIAGGSGVRPGKERTVIEDGVFIGSASQAIAPVTLGAGSFVATGTSVTENVPPDSFVIGRGRQVTKAGYAKKFGKAKPSSAD